MRQPVLLGQRRCAAISRPELIVRNWCRRILSTIGWIPRAEFLTVLSEDHPSHTDLKVGIICVVGGPGFQKWAYMRCPCGCSSVIMLSLSKSRKPKWEVKNDWFNRPTVHPSVWQTSGCFSHFWVRSGQVTWVKDTGTKPPPTYTI
jgi:hypothetical protein